MSKKSVVYIASNHQGLHSELGEIVQVLATNGCIPLVYSQALTSDDIKYNWDGAKTLIDDSDFMIAVVGNSYGSLLDTGESGLHKEIAYAQARGIPVIAFLKNVSRDQIPSGEEQKLKLIHKMVMKGFFKYWHLRDELLTQIEMGLKYVNKQFDLKGWIPATDSTNSSSKGGGSRDKSAKLTLEKIDELERLWPINFVAKVFAHGNIKTVEKSISLSWAQTFLAIGPELITPVTEEKIKDCLELHVQSEFEGDFKKLVPDAHAVTDVQVSKPEFQKLKAYMNGIGIVKSVNRPGQIQSYWQLTEAGSSRLNRLLAESFKSHVS